MPRIGNSSLCIIKWFALAEHLEKLGLRITENYIDHAIFFTFDGDGAGACKLADTGFFTLGVMKLHAWGNGSDDQTGRL